MEDAQGSGQHSTLSTIFLGRGGSKRRQAISDAKSSVNILANSVLNIAEPEAQVVRDDSGCALVQDVEDPQGRILGKEMSKRLILLESARSSLERAHMKIAEKGEDLKNKTNRGLSNATESLARGMQKLMPKPMEEKEGEQAKAAEADNELYTKACPTCRFLGVPQWCTDRMPKSRYDVDNHESPRKKSSKSLQKVEEESCLPDA